VDLMKLGVEAPEALIDLRRLPLDYVRADGGSVRIGAMVRNTDLAYHPLVQDRYPVLSQAILSGATPQLRNMATVGGNLMQRTRCAYFRSPDLPCNKRAPGSGCGALKGIHRNHAVLGTSDQCIATHPSDLCVALVALDAIVHIEGRGGKRSVALEEFYLLPRETPERETVLAHHELITEVEIPVRYARRSHYLKVRERASYEFALTSAAVALDLEHGVIRSARLALGGVGTVPWRLKTVERTLAGREATTAVFREAAEEALTGAKANPQNAFKIELAKATLVRALETVA
jgi:xanthine dehydrogenase YagS FAD-binding subunit